jgi:hypothetical protein
MLPRRSERIGDHIGIDRHRSTVPLPPPIINTAARRAAILQAVCPSRPHRSGRMTTARAIRIIAEPIRRTGHCSKTRPIGGRSGRQLAGAAA